MLRFRWAFLRTPRQPESLPHIRFESRPASKDRRLRRDGSESRRVPRVVGGSPNASAACTGTFVQTTSASITTAQMLARMLPKHWALFSQAIAPINISTLLDCSRRRRKISDAMLMITSNRARFSSSILRSGMFDDYKSVSFW